MAENKNSNRSIEDDAADYSGYFKKPEPMAVAPQEPTSPLQELPARKTFSKKLKYLLVVLAILAVAQGVYIFILMRAKNPPLPEGYELVSPGNGPPVIMPIK